MKKFLWQSWFILSLTLLISCILHYALPNSNILWQTVAVSQSQATGSRMTLHYSEVSAQDFHKSLPTLERTPLILDCRGPQAYLESSYPQAQLMTGDYHHLLPKLRNTLDPTQDIVFCFGEDDLDQRPRHVAHLLGSKKGFPLQVFVIQGGFQALLERGLIGKEKRDG